MSDLRKCACGCGRALIKRKDEERWQFETRKYASRECSAKGRIGKRDKEHYNDVKARKDNMRIHPLLNRFIYS